MSVSSARSKRWLKRWSRRMVATGAHSARVVGGLKPVGGLRILTYHRIEDDSQDPFAVQPAIFRAQMSALVSSHSVVSLSEALHELDEEDPLRSRITLTFDDGTRDFLSEALPVLLDCHLPATLYVSPFRVGATGFLEWKELRTICNQGIAVESHGLDHQSLARLSPEDLWRQVKQSREMLEDNLGRAVTSIAYPYGTFRDFNSDVKESVNRAGYTSGCSSVNGINRPGADRLELRRTKIEQGDQPIFPWILSGCLDGWAIIDRYFARLQNRYS